MPRVLCPGCEIKATVVGFGGDTKPYCARCGWNCGAAEALLLSELGISKWMAGPLLAIGLILWLLPSEKAKVWGGLGITFGGIIGIFGLIGWLQLVILRRQVARLEAEGGTSGVHLVEFAADNKAQDLLARIVAIRRPRRIRMTLAGWRNATIYVSFLGLVAFALRASFGDEGVDSFFWFGVLCLLSLIPAVGFVRRWRRERPLLREGEVCLGRVVGQQDEYESKYSRASRVTYSFHVPSMGRNITTAAKDASHSLYEGMPVIVFYDPVDPTNNVALKCSRHEVVLTD